MLAAEIASAKAQAQNIVLIAVISLSGWWPERRSTNHTSVGATFYADLCICAPVALTAPERAFVDSRAPLA